MIRGYAVADVRRAESAALAGLAEGELMKRAATGLEEVTRARAEQHEAGRIVGIIGAGDNGGDALFALAGLTDAFEVAAVVLADTVHPAGRRVASAAGVTLIDGRDEAAALATVGGAQVVLDAIVGIGGRPGLRPQAAALRDAVPAQAYVIAVDLPSGADPSGEVASDCFWADETVTFGLVKPVHLMPASEPACGVLTVVDIGVESSRTPRVERLTRAEVAARWPVPGPFDDKYTRGVLGLITGSDRYPGAAVLSTTAAVSAGVGMARYVGPPTAADAVRAAVPEAVLGIGRVQAWVIGSGMSVDDRTSSGRAQARRATEALASTDPCVVDAGGLDLLDGPRGAPTLLTPHAGELARLAGRVRPRGMPRVGRGRNAWVELVRARPLVVAQGVADRLDATVLLKGAVTLVVPPSSHRLPVRSQADGPAWLATAGSGDVLAGLAGTLLAAGLEPLEAGSVAAAVHGYAGHHVNPGGPVRALALAQGLAGTVAALLNR